MAPREIVESFAHIQTWHHIHIDQKDEFGGGALSSRISKHIVRIRNVALVILAIVGTVVVDYCPQFIAVVVF